MTFRKPKENQLELTLYTVYNFLCLRRKNDKKLFMSCVPNTSKFKKN